MTRMVEENSREIGALKALGYTKLEIAKKYAIYARLASGIGILLGTVLGTNLLPRIIFELSNEQYDIGSAVIFMIGRQSFKQQLLSLLQRLVRR